MNKQRNKANLPHISIAERPNSIPTSASPSAQRPIPDIPHHDTTAAAEGTHDEIAVRAYEIYVEEGRPQGQSDEIWRRAELEQRSNNVAALHPKKRG